MSGAASVAKDSSRLENIFYNSERSSNGVYALRVYVLGVRHSIIFDDTLPLINGNTIFAHISEDNAIWPLLIEKAYAKFNGNYEALVGGNPKDSINFLTGAPFKRYKHSEKNADEIWDIINTAFKANNMVSIISPPVASGANGIAQKHVYTVLNTLVVNDLKLYRVRNPWGSEGYHGPWSDKSDLWDEDTKRKVDYLDKNDGLFFIDHNQFHHEFKAAVVHFDTTKMKQAYYLVSNDASTRPSTARRCRGCILHSFTVTSPVTQNIYLNFHVWPHRSYPEDCKGAWRGKHRFRYKARNSNKRYPGDNIGVGYKDFASRGGFEIGAGEQLIVEMSMNWKPGMTKDFSLVIWSDGDKKVTIKENFPETKRFKRDGWNYSELIPM